MSDRNETPHLILQELGQKKCNGDVESATENITIEQIKSVVNKQKSKLTGTDMSAMCREVMGTCVAMRQCCFFVPLVCGDQAAFLH